MEASAAHPKRPISTTSLISQRRAKEATGDHADVDLLFRAHEERLGRFLTAMLRDRWLADDVLQDTFLAAVRDYGRLAPIENPEAWLFSIARRRALTALRKRSRGWVALQRLVRGHIETEEADPLEAISVRDFLIRHLRDEERALLVLRYVHGFNAQELAQIFDRSPDAVRQNLSRARKRLAERLSEYPPEQPGGLR